MSLFKTVAHKVVYLEYEQLNSDEGVYISDDNKEKRRRYEKIRLSKTIRMCEFLAQMMVIQ